MANSISTRIRDWRCCDRNGTWCGKRSENQSPPVEGANNLERPLEITAEKIRRTKGTAMMLKDRVAIVTGAARGIGQEYSLGLVREGAKVVVTDLLSCDETVAKVQKAGCDVLALKTGVTSEQSTRAMAEETVQHFG